MLLCHPPPIPQTLSVKQRLLHMDWAGAVLLLGSMVCLLIALQQGGLAWAWSSSRMIGLLVGFFAITAFFFVLQGFLGERSSISLRLMRDRSVAAVCFVNFTCGASYYSILYYTAIFYQVVSIKEQPGTGNVCVLTRFPFPLRPQVQGSTPVRAGIQMLPLIFFNMAFGMLSGWSVSRFGVFHPAMWIGTSMTALGAGLHASLNQYSGDGEWIVFGMIVGTGMGESSSFTVVLRPPPKILASPSSAISRTRVDPRLTDEAACCSTGALYMMSFVASQILVEDPRDKSRAASLVCFWQIWGATAWVSVSNSIYSNSFKRGISRIPGVDVEAVLASGVDRFREVVSPEQLEPVTNVAVSSLFDVFLASAMLGTAGFIGVFAIRWVNIGSSKKNKTKKTVAEKEEAAVDSVA